MSLEKETTLNAADMQHWLRDRAGIRVGPHTAEYAARQCTASHSTAGFYVIGADARTGRPIRRLIPPALLAEAAGTASSNRAAQ